MKKILLISAFLFSFSSFGQDDNSSCIIVGANQYYNNANFLSSNSKTGFTVGIGAKIYASKYSQILSEMTFSRFNMDFLGRETLTSEPEWFASHLDRVNLNLIYDYDVINLLDDDLNIGISAGVSGALATNFKTKDKSKEEYYFDPYGGAPNFNLFSAFAIGGISVRYDRYEINVRYNKAITNTYSTSPNSFAYVTPKGKDDYISFTLHWYSFD